MYLLHRCSFTLYFKVGLVSIKQTQAGLDLCSRLPKLMRTTVITRLMIMSMETSSMTAIVAVLNLVLFLPLQNTAYHLLPQFSMSRVYTITVMVTLLARPSLRGALLSTDHLSLGTSLQGGEETTNRDMTTGKGPIRVSSSLSSERHCSDLFSGRSFYDSTA